MENRFLAAFVVVSLGMSAPHAAEMGAKDEPIKLALNEWTGQHISTHIAGETLKRAGYKVEYVTAGMNSQIVALSDGDLHATMEVWSSNMPEGLAKAQEAGKLKDIGALGIDAREGFVYPVHVKSMCPGLPAWEALKNCQDKFATAETLPEGRLIDYPADWGTPGADRLKGLALPYKAVPAGSEGALISELKASVTKKSPLLMVFWQPHWALSEYEVEWVDLPKAENACFEDPSWGVNPSEVSDCDFSTSRLFKVVWSGFEDKWPAAYKILESVTVTTADQQSMMAAVDLRSEPIEDVIADWVAKNSSAIDGWVAAAN